MLLGSTYPDNQAVGTRKMRKIASSSYRMRGVNTGGLEKIVGSPNPKLLDAMFDEHCKGRLLVTACNDL